MTPGTTKSRATALRLLLALGATIVASLSIFSGSASAVYSHDVIEKTFEAAPGCEINDIALDESAGYIYVSCGSSIERFNLDGSPAEFSFVAPYIEGNKLTGDPGGQGGNFNFGDSVIAVDNSNSPNKGRLFVTSSPNVDIFNPSGQYFSNVTQPVESTIENELGALDVGPDGSIYVGSQFPGARISKYDPALHEVKKLYGSGEAGFLAAANPCYVSVDSTGAAWYSYCATFGVQAGLIKYEADQFTEELEIPALGATAEELAPFVAKPSPFAATKPIVENNYTHYDVDLNTNDLYINHANKVEVYSQGTADEPIHQDAPSFGTGGRALEYANNSNKVYTSQGHTVTVFGPGDIVPNVRTFAPAIADIGHTSAIVRGKVEPAGGGDITSCKFQYAADAAYTSEVGEVSCDPDASTTNFSGDTEVTGEITGLQTGKKYHVRLIAGNAKGQNTGIDRTFVPAYVLQLQTLPATAITTDGAQLNGSFDPDGEETSYLFEYGINDSYGLTLPVDEEAIKSVPGTNGVIEVGEVLNGVPSGKTFHYRIVAFNGEGTTFGPDLTFRVGSAPDISGVRTTDVAETAAVLHAEVNPVGSETTYQFRYGTTPSYDHKIPLTPEGIGSGNEAVKVEQAIEGLTAGVTYHYEIVATNQYGTSSSPDTTFDYAPPGCPNDHVRQQTISSYLPDCRAYELVSPGDAGAVLLYPSNAVSRRGEGTEGVNQPYNEGLMYILNRGFASGPSRFSFYGGVGTITGIYSPNAEVDMYMSTRTNGGWVTTLPGLTGNDAETTGRKECSESMALCIDHQEAEAVEFHREFSPYLYTAAGEYRGRLPTNVNVIPNGTRFHGNQRMSGDFSHYVFSSSEYENFEGHLPGIAFTPEGLTTGVGSAYDNDIANKTVTLISRMPDGKTDIPTDSPTPIRAVDFPGVSPDGSHILMQTNAGGKNRHLYMRVNDLVTYQIDLGLKSKEEETEAAEKEVESFFPKGEGVEPIGMTRNGSEVLYATKAQMTEEDNDTSTDIYKWEEAGDKTTLISGGPTLPVRESGDPATEHPVGSTDQCSASWEPSGCGAVPLSPERAHPNANQAVSVPSSQDDLFAENTGAVYFYSAENLDPASPGIPNQRNLYVYREGAVHFVATFDPGTAISRMQISPDGQHAAWVTKSLLTTYNSKGFAEMYVYDAETGAIQCASCNPTGQPPIADVGASQGGRFMSDDGRAFFSTQDRLVPRDQNGKIIDVYEYVGGRPQLITSGLSGRDFTGGGETIHLFSAAEHTGLEAVSHDGTDVFFSTFETLVGRDHNGQFVKFYDARSGGGFDESPPLGPCAAADECHGVDSSPPPPPVIASGEQVTGGNVQPAKSKKQSQKKKKAHKKKHKSRRHHARQNRG